MVRGWAGIRACSNSFWRPRSWGIAMSVHIWPVLQFPSGPKGIGNERPCLLGGCRWVPLSHNGGGEDPNWSFFGMAPSLVCCGWGGRRCSREVWRRPPPAPATGAVRVCRIPYSAPWCGPELEWGMRQRVDPVLSCLHNGEPGGTHAGPND